MVTPPQPVKRYISNVLDDAAETSFDLVVNSMDNQFTYGGGRVTIGKPYNDAQMERAIDSAVEQLVRQGNGALPKGIPRGSVPQAEPPRAIRLHLDRRNAQDRGH